jgi:hypothetical protein
MHILKPSCASMAGDRFGFVTKERTDLFSEHFVDKPLAPTIPSPRRSTRLRSVLSIGLAPEVEFEGIKLTRAASPRDVIEMLRVLDFSLLLVSASAQDVATWKLIDTVRRYWPQLRWVLLTENCSDEEEILARSLGASSVTANPEVILELASNRRKMRA